MRQIIQYNPRLKDYAKKLRQNMTLAEVLLWKRLKGGQVKGRDFDRQRPIGEYIVDFYCKEMRLAIEVDGNSHDFKVDKDAERQGVLEELGVRFLRFWDHDVKTDMAAVIRRIEEWVDENEPTPPKGTPPQEGNGRGEGICPEERVGEVEQDLQ